MRFIVRASLLPYLAAVIMMAALSPVFALSLEAYSNNLASCIRSLPERDLLQEKIRICKVRRARSLLYSNVNACTQRSVQVYRGCQLMDSAGIANIPVITQIAASQARTISLDEISKVYSGGQFHYDGWDYQVIDGRESENILQRKRGGRAWANYCILSFNHGGYSCFYSTGHNRPGAFVFSYSDRCTYESMKLSLNLTYVSVILESSSRKFDHAERNQVFPGVVTNYYKCSIASEDHSVPWQG